MLLALTATLVAALAWIHDQTRTRIEANRNAAFWQLAESMSGDTTLRHHASRPEPGAPIRLADAGILGMIRTPGYGGPVELLILVDADGTIAAVQTLGHSETPGIGDFIDGETAWMRQFSGLDPADLPFIDGRTGATITADAVRQGVEAFVMNPGTAR
jgi:hypothetical protein